MDIVSDLLKEVKKRFPELTFAPSSAFYWSPKQQTIFYEPEKLGELVSAWALLHEISHALLKHTTYKNDVNLLVYEVAAWQQAEKLAKDFNITIDPDHIEDCLDTYRDWLYARSTCPTCSLNALQIRANTYRCLNCQCEWQVSPSRFCRPYRMQGRHQKTSPELLPATFQ